jgi:beta-glucosidase
MYPRGLEQTLRRVADDYAPERIYVTESGSAWLDELTPEGEIQDKERTDYLEQHIEAVTAAAVRGVPVEGYFVWSLLDNFEWSYGYDKRFGLVHVDYPTQRRTVKASGYRYAEIIRAHRRARWLARSATP